MLSKNKVPVAIIVLLAVAALIAGASQVLRAQVPSGSVVLAPGAVQGNSGQQAVPAAPSLPAATGQVAFSDGFDAADQSAWQTLAEGGKWVNTAGRLEQRGNSDGEISSSASTYIVKGSNFSDFVYEAQVYPTSGEPVGVVFRGSDTGYYRVTLAPNLPNNAPKAVFDKVAPDGTTKMLAENKSWKGFALAAWQRVQVSAQGSHFSVSLDGAPLFDVNNADLASGWVGVWTVADMGAVFDNVRVQSSVASR